MRAGDFRREFGNAEIEKLYEIALATALRNDDVVGFEIAVHDPTTMRGRQRVGGLVGNRDCAFLRKRAFAAHELRQRLASQKLHDEVHEALAALAVKHAIIQYVDNIGVTNVVDGFGFVEKARDHFLVACVFGVQDFQRHALADVRVLGEIDRAHSAFTDFLSDLVIPYGLPNESIGACVRCVIGGKFHTYDSTILAQVLLLCLFWQYLSCGKLAWLPLTWYHRSVRLRHVLLIAGCVFHAGIDNAQALPISALSSQVSENKQNTVGSRGGSARLANVERASRKTRAKASKSRRNRKNEARASKSNAPRNSRTPSRQPPRAAASDDATSQTAADTSAASIAAEADWAPAGKPPKTACKGVAVIDAETGIELYGKSADEPRAIASTTKIFVAMAVRQKGLDLDAWTEIIKSDARAARGGARTRLDVGQRFKNIDLLRAMLMASDNRAPTALGRAAGLSSDELIAEMNAIAKRLGLRRTKFTDTSGLRGNVSTPREMALALRAALADEVLREIMGDDVQDVYSKGGRYRVDYTNTNTPLIEKRYQVIGGKTGFTEPAGYCLVTAARLHGRTVLFALYGANEKGQRFRDFNRLAAWLSEGGAGASARLSPISSTETRKRRRAAEVSASGTVNVGK